jgi:hypothetical protein
MTPTLATRWLPVLLTVALWANPGAAHAQAAAEALLEARMREFTASVGRVDEDGTVAFFPHSGDFTWVETTHRRDGDVVGIWRFSAADFRAAYRGPLNDVLTVDHHGQPVGSLSHQVMIRRPRWRRARGNRFIPADAPDSSPLYVQWRREDGRWVVSEIGDESYNGDAPLPAWCC